MFFIRSFCWFIIVWVIAVALFSQPLLAAKKNIYPTKKITQSQLPYVTKGMLQADYWIRRSQLSGNNENKNLVIKNKTSIQQLNRSVLSKGYISEPLKKAHVINFSLLKKYFKEDLAILHHYIKYDSKGQRRRDPKFSNYLADLINLKEVLKKRAKERVPSQPAIVVATKRLRAFPTDEVFVRRLGDEAFDIFIKTVLPLYTGVSILWESKDRDWVYVESPLTRGWLKKSSLVVFPASTSSKSQIKNKLGKATNGKATDFSQIRPLLKSINVGKFSRQVVINRRAVLYRLTKNKKWLATEESFPMGSVLPISTFVPSVPAVGGREGHDLQVIVHPQTRANNEVYAVEKADLSENFLPFTRANVFRQAFKFLGSDYGWGGNLDQTDCSLFFYYVFRSFGILLPRSSAQQVNVLSSQRITHKAELYQTLKASPLGLTLAYIKGPNHIMLYLGREQKRDFFIHSTWSFKDSNFEYLTSSVVVSDLSLGEKHYLGSLGHKIVKIGHFMNF